MNTDKKLNWAILTTGWGRNAKDTIKAYADGKLGQARIKLLVYQDEPSGAKDEALLHNIETLRVVKKDFRTTQEYQKHLINQLQKRDIDYIFLLSYRYIVREDMLKAFPNRIINIHPSLFPSFLATTTAIQEALDYGVKISGITTHIIDNEIDRGTILCQEPIRFKEGETFETAYPKFAETGKKIIPDTMKLIENRHFMH